MEVTFIRSKFQALSRDQIFLDNAAGSQILESCANAIHDYLVRQNVQPAMPYGMSTDASTRIHAGYQAAANHINASPQEIVFGPSTTQLVRNVSLAIKFEAGDEIVLSKIDHEAHLASWVQVAKWNNLTIRWWVPSRDTTTNPKLEADDLKAQNLIRERTKLIAFTHTSNVLGSITDVASISRTVKSINPKTLVSVDAVAYAAHGPIDVQAFGVDFYFFSWYKVFGPHFAMAFVKQSNFAELESLGHFFLPKSTATQLFGLANDNFEFIQSIPTITSYLHEVGWDWIRKQEGLLLSELLDYINSEPKIQLLGERSADPSFRTSVVSFIVKGRASTEVVRDIYAESRCTPTSGNFYAVRLCQEVIESGQDNEVVRCSMLHYNTIEELREFVGVLKRVVAKK